MSQDFRLQVRLQPLLLSETAGNSANIWKHWDTTEFGLKALFVTGEITENAQCGWTEV